jgi:hypothetical protein
VYKTSAFHLHRPTVYSPVAASNDCVNTPADAQTPSKAEHWKQHSVRKTLHSLLLTGGGDKETAKSPWKLVNGRTKRTTLHKYCPPVTEVKTYADFAAHWSHTLHSIHLRNYAIQQPQWLLWLPLFKQFLWHLFYFMDGGKSGCLVAVKHKNEGHLSIKDTWCCPILMVYLLPLKKGYLKIKDTFKISVTNVTW